VSLDLCFAILTHKRNALLQAALDSVLAAERPKDFAVEIVVIDNSDAGEAAPVVAKAGVRGLAAHPANISVARNAARGACRAPWLAFLDDDQTIAPDWFVEARRATRQTTADILFGAIVPRFEAPGLAGPSARKLFTRDLALAEGAPLLAFGPQRTRAAALTPGNALFRYETTLAREAFDPAFGLAGGEDFDLFCRLQRQGRRFSWRPSLRASEFVPAARCDSAYLRRRFYAGGQVYAAAVARASGRPALARGGLRAKALLQALTLAPAAALGTDEARYRLAGALGKLSWGGLHPLYGQA
jgi:succinoglycan biosynthesis protein ExoM